MITFIAGTFPLGIVPGVRAGRWPWPTLRRPVAARAAAAAAVRSHDEAPSTCRAVAATELVGLYGHLLRLEGEAWAAYTKRAFGARPAGSWLFAGPGEAQALADAARSQASRLAGEGRRYLAGVPGGRPPGLEAGGGPEVALCQP
ncbi:MAG: hypothetical protein WKF86_05970 [Acidimicrobiales bacterium]